ncbi:MAG: acyl-CoA reductase [Flavobacteriaceae bacterium]
MMNSKIDAIKQLGAFFRDYKRSDNGGHFFSTALQNAHHANCWFDHAQLEHALHSWGTALTEENIDHWLEALIPTKNPKTIGLVLAGNIPFVGLHDLLCVWVSGHRAVVKTATKDPYLLPAVVALLEEFAPANTGQIVFTKQKMTDFDAVIATGSDNAARYFEYYFSKVPHLIRKNRNGVAVLNGNETEETVKGLAEDMLRYYGMGCRNVSQLFVPKGFDLDLIFGALYPFHEIIQSEKYANNYDYNKAVFLMSDFDFTENGFFMLREALSWSAPIATAAYHYYENSDSLMDLLNKEKERIQCVVSEMAIPGTVPIGKSQQPQLWDYADGKNTLEFLQTL